MTTKITACPRCGSTRISAGRMGSGVLFGITSWEEECRNCGYQGSPLVFHSKEEYQRFVDSLKQNRKPASKEECKESDLSCEEQKVVDFLKELESESSDDERSGSSWHQDKSWWPEVLLAVMLSVLSLVVVLPQSAAWLGVEVSLVYSVFFFVLNVVASLFGIVVIEYFVHLLRDSIFRP